MPRVVALKKLIQKNSKTAKAIYKLFQAGYRAEAALIGVDVFPPLSRTCRDIMTSMSDFYAIEQAQSLSAIIEMTTTHDLVAEIVSMEIHSMVVAPSNFRCGLGSQLLQMVFEISSFNRAIVDTAVKNIPAIKLYEKFGFRICKYWQTVDGISMVNMLYENRKLP